MTARKVLDVLATVATATTPHAYGVTLTCVRALAAHGDYRSALTLADETIVDVAGGAVPELTQLGLLTAIAEELGLRGKSDLARGALDEVEARLRSLDFSEHLQEPCILEDSITLAVARYRVGDKEGAAQRLGEFDVSISEALRVAAPYTGIEWR